MPGIEVLIVRFVKFHTHSQLFEIAQASGIACLFSSLIESRQQHAGENGDNCDDDQKFDQGKEADVFESFFLSLSSLCNVGYGSNLFDGGTFVELPMGIKWLLAFDMLIGRLELFTVLILFTKGFWIK